ncbi:hypothetical protein ACP275_14G241200 [Erythranthe tilingii]
MARQLRDDRKAAPCSFDQNPGKEIESPSPPPPVIPSIASNHPRINIIITDSIIFNNSLKRGRFDDDDDDDVTIREDKDGFKLTKASTKRRRPSVSHDFLTPWSNRGDDDDKTIKNIPTGEQQQQEPVPLPPEDDDDITRLTLGWWAPHTPTIIESDDNQVVLPPPPDNNNNPFLELRIGPPIQRRRVFPDGYWEITKSLTQSDVNGSSRLLLPRKLVLDHILVYLDNVELAAVYEEDGLEVTVLDVDTDTHHILAFKLWSSSSSYVLAKNWISDFVRRRGLSENREIGIRWDRRPGSRSLEFTLFH